MRRQGAVDDGTAARWLQAMRALFPDVNDGSRITGVHKPGVGAQFHVDGRLRGSVDEPEFARRFFGIWLSPASSDPKLRAALLGLNGRGVFLKAAPVSAAAGPWRGGWAQGLRYGALGLPLAFVALPLAVVLPNHYAREFGIPLATLGALLLGARLLDAFTDPAIGRWVDCLFAVAARRVLGAAVAAAVVLAVAFRALFFPPQALRGDTQWLLVWCALALLAAYLSYSVLTVLHQAWGRAPGRH